VLSQAFAKLDWLAKSGCLFSFPFLQSLLFFLLTSQNISAPMLIHTLIAKEKLLGDTARKMLLYESWTNYIQPEQFFFFQDCFMQGFCPTCKRSSCSDFPL